MSEPRTDEIWKEARQAEHFITGTRHAIPLAAEQIALTLALAEKGAAHHRRFLDLGCGDGILGRALLERWGNGYCVFGDFSPHMLEAARAKLTPFEGRSLVVELDFASSDWKADVIAHAPYDVIVSGYAIHHQPDEVKRRLYHDIYELLSPGGMFLHLEHVKAATPWVEEVFREQFLRGLYAWHRSVGDHRSEESIKEEWLERQVANQLAPVDDQLRWLEDIGFHDVDCYFRIFELALFGGRKVG